MKTILALLFATASLIAADATGTWTGTFTPAGEGPGPAHLILKQEGTTVTGTAGPNSDDQHPIQNGKAEPEKLTFEIIVDDMLLKFTGKQEGDDLKGDVSVEKNGEVRKAVLVVKRNK